jgi:hypothetical protein
VFLRVFLFCCVYLSVCEIYFFGGEGSIPTGKDLSSMYEKPFHGKQKAIRCRGCDICFHCVCLKVNNTEIVFFTASSNLSCLY